MRIKLSNSKGQIKTFEVDENMTIKKAKEITGEIAKLWIFCGEILKEDKTFSDYGIEEDDLIISTYEMKGGGGSFGLNTIDVSKNNTRIVEFDYNAPYYRRVINGLSIQAICGNDCIAKDKIVYCTIGFVRNYDILQNVGNGNIKCPACGNPIYPKNFKFLKM